MQPLNCNAIGFLRRAFTRAAIDGSGRSKDAEVGEGITTPPAPPSSPLLLSEEGSFEGVAIELRYDPMTVAFQ